MDIVRVSQITSENLPVSVAKSTLYSWRHKRKFPGLFIKIGGALYLDVQRLREIIESGRE